MKYSHTAERSTGTGVIIIVSAMTLGFCFLRRAL